MNHATQTQQNQHDNTAKMSIKLPGDLSVEAHAATIRHFRQFVANPANRPSKDPNNGTKYPGRIALIHFMFYAILRGKSPESTSHAPTESLKYQSVLRQLSALPMAANASLLRELHLAFGLSEGDVRAVMSTLKQ